MTTERVNMLDESEDMRKYRGLYSDDNVEFVRRSEETHGVSH
jgi:hypothetical protein